VQKQHLTRHNTKCRPSGENAPACDNIVDEIQWFSDWSDIVAMPLHIFLLVLCAALLHASWNAIIKSGGSTPLDTVALTVAAAILAAVALPFTSLPSPESWPWLVLSVALHVAYFLMLGAVYGIGDLSHVYPLMRGVAPLLVALAGVMVLGESLSMMVWMGIALICAGILLPVLRHPAVLRERATPLAFAIGLVIAAYTLVDGYGTRASGNSFSYSLWMFLLEAPPIVLVAWLKQRRLVWQHVRIYWRRAAVGGVCVIGSYSIALWAMVSVPIAAVAALRETSVLFAAIIGCTLLKERLGIWRVAGAATIAAGMVLLRL
jgi:drug/metabolite transporter (DMT)-like permease